jgi:thioesterase domain-containing protein
LAVNQLPRPADAELSQLLDDLQHVLDHEIPMCGQMGIRVVGCDDNGLVMMLPLATNRNHQQTAFAGSLNALCTIAGWGTTYLLLRQHRLPGEIVIRRSTIKYHRPVDTSEIFARCLPVADSAREYFAEMIFEKGQAKLDLVVEIAGDGSPLVSFAGSYVVADSGREPKST